jgi:hypothetical protein
MEKPKTSSADVLLYVVLVILGLTCAATDRVKHLICFLKYGRHDFRASTFRGEVLLDETMQCDRCNKYVES